MSSTTGLASSLRPSNLFELWSLLLCIHLVPAAVTKLIIHHSSRCFHPNLRFLCIKTTGPCPPCRNLPPRANYGNGDAASALMLPPGQSWVSSAPGPGDSHQICPEIQWRFWLDTLMSSLTTCSCTASFCKWTSVSFAKMLLRFSAFPCWDTITSIWIIVLSELPPD